MVDELDVISIEIYVLNVNKETHEFIQIILTLNTGVPLNLGQPLLKDFPHLIYRLWPGLEPMYLRIAFFKPVCLSADKDARCASNLRLRLFLV